VRGARFRWSARFKTGENWCKTGAKLVQILAEAGIPRERLTAMEICYRSLPQVSEKHIRRGRTDQKAAPGFYHFFTVSLPFLTLFGMRRQVGSIHPPGPVTS
jgi:hypothetical protein